jgi:hypothetical protein
MRISLHCCGRVVGNLVEEFKSFLLSGLSVESGKVFYKGAQLEINRFNSSLPASILEKSRRSSMQCKSFLPAS